jgi:hypothetical protein
MKWIVIACVLAACGPKPKNQCPGNAVGHCVAGEVCTFDHSRGCQSCQCRPLDQAPGSRDPDDPTPPVPVH